MSPGRTRVLVSALLAGTVGVVGLTAAALGAPAAASAGTTTAGVGAAQRAPSSQSPTSPLGALPTGPASPATPTASSPTPGTPTTASSTPSASPTGDPTAASEPTATAPDETAPTQSTIGAPPPPTPPPGAPSVTQTIDIGGTTRTFLLSGVHHGARRPLLVLFHGLGQDTQEFLAETGIVGAANRAGVVVAAPESPDLAWNDGRFGPAGRDDDAFAMQLLATLVGRGVVDPKRVTVAGFSNGAGMAMELAARHPDAIAAVVSVDGELVSTGASLPSGPVPAFFVHGTADPTQPLMGRATLSYWLPAQVSEQQTINAFLTANGGNRVRGSVSVLPPLPYLLTGRATVRQWLSKTGVPSAYVLINGLGHKWPVLPCGEASTDTTTARVNRALGITRGGCSPVAYEDTRLAQVSGNGLVLGVAKTAVLHHTVTATKRRPATVLRSLTLHQALASPVTVLPGATKKKAR